MRNMPFGDEQLILSFNPIFKHILGCFDNNLQNQTQSFTKMEKCIQDIQDFLLENKLCNNSEKTEFMLIGCPHYNLAK